MRLLNFFGNLLVFIQISRTTNFSNEKLGLQFYQGGDALQVTILPKSVLHQDKPFSGVGSMTKAQEAACAVNCGFKVMSLPNSLKGYRCYVNNEARTAALSAKKVYDKTVADPGLMDYFNPQINPINYIVRVSVWGDIGRLNAEGQEALLCLCENASQVRGYSSDFDKLIHVERWRNLIQASCQTKSHVDLARLLGFKVYLGTQEAYDYAKPLGRVYRCPWTSKNRNRVSSKFEASVKYGCVNCKLSCNGRYDIDGRHI